jgi:hypothetical protein
LPVIICPCVMTFSLITQSALTNIICGDVRVTTFRRRFCETPGPFVDDFAGHPVLPTHLPDRIVNVIGGSYTHVHTLPHPKWHETIYTNFMATNKQREMRFIFYY